MRWKPVSAVIAATVLIAAILFFWQKRPPAKLPTIETILAVHEGKFKCTLYYTPREAGFTAAEGFNITPATRPGLRGREFPHDFLIAVEKEGFGRLKQPFNGKLYVRYWSGTWGYCDRPVDHRQRPLVARQSCAMSAQQKLLSPLARFAVRSREVDPSFQDLRWIACDTGSGLDTWQLDLYWGESDPLGPGRRLSRPKDAPVEIGNATIVVFR